jgi:hypothetical protein
LATGIFSLAKPNFTRSNLNYGVALPVNAIDIYDRSLNNSYFKMLNPQDILYVAHRIFHIGSSTIDVQLFILLSFLNSANHEIKNYKETSLNYLIYFFKEKTKVFTTNLGEIESTRVDFSEFLNIYQKRYKDNFFISNSISLLNNIFSRPNFEYMKLNFMRHIFQITIGVRYANVIYYLRSENKNTLCISYKMTLETLKNIV